MKNILNILYIIIITLAISNCTNVKMQENVQNSKVDKTIIDKNKIKTIESYVNYYGIIPGEDDCIAIEVNIYLTNFKTFIQQEKHLYKDYQTLKITHGVFTFDDNDRSLIKLSNGLTYKIHNKTTLQKFKKNVKINLTHYIKQKSIAKKIYNIDIDHNLKKIE